MRLSGPRLRVIVVVTLSVVVFTKVASDTIVFVSANTNGDEDLKARAAGLLGIDLIAIIALALSFAILFVPGIVRARRVGARVPTGVIFFTTRVNPELRRFVVEDGVLLSFRDGMVRPALRFSVTMVVGRSGVEVWAGSGTLVARFDPNTIRSIEVSKRQEGLRSMPALRLTTSNGSAASFLVAGGTGVFPLSLQELIDLKARASVVLWRTKGEVVVHPPLL